METAKRVVLWVLLFTVAGGGSVRCQSSGTRTAAPFDLSADGAGSNHILDWIQEVQRRHKAAAESRATAAGPVASPPTNAQGPSSSSSADIIIVDQKGTGNYSTVQEAIDAVPANNERSVTILVRPGVYREQVHIPRNKPHIILRGSGLLNTKITYHLNSRSANGTYRSASVFVRADHFTAGDISFENSAPVPAAGAVGMQAVALLVEGDKAAFYRCGFYGHQDTLYDRSGRHYFDHCYIEGTVDFIFGNGRSLYKSCELHSIAKHFGAVTAQKRNSEIDDGGYSFVDCNVTGTGRTYLGRAWGTYSRVVFAKSSITVRLNSPHWANWNSPARERTVFYGQYNCTGLEDETVEHTWYHELTLDQATPFLTDDFIDGEEWLRPI